MGGAVTNKIETIRKPLGKLQIRVLEAQKLIAMDSPSPGKLDASSDPYVDIHLEGSYWRSEKVEKTLAGAFGLVGPNALLNALVDAAERLGRSSGRRRAIVVVSGTSPGHTDWSPRDVTSRVGKARAVVRGACLLTM